MLNSYETYKYVRPEFKSDKPSNNLKSVNNSLISKTHRKKTWPQKEVERMSGLMKRSVYYTFIFLYIVQLIFPQTYLCKIIFYTIYSYKLNNVNTFLIVLTSNYSSLYNS